MRLSDYDASFLYRETPATPMHGASICVLEGELSIEDLRRHVAQSIPNAPRYRQKLAFVPMQLAHPKWIDDPGFDLANHVFAHPLPRGASLDEGIDQCLEIAATPLSRDHPLWQIWLISGIPDHTLILQLTHQSMIDNAAGIDPGDVFLNVRKQSVTEGEAEPLPPWEPEAEPDSMTLASEAVIESSAKLREAGQRLANFTPKSTEMMRRAAETLTRFIAEPVITAPWNRSAVSQRRTFSWRKYPFADVRRIRNVLGGTVNDVVLAIVVEAAARYLERQGIEATGQHLRVMCPVSVRRQDADGVRGNRVTGTFPVFRAETADMHRRLRDVQWETESIKQNNEAQALQLLTEMAPPTPPFALQGMQLMAQGSAPVSNLMSSLLPAMPGLLPAPVVGFNFACTTVPGAQTTQYYAGHQVIESLALLTLRDNVGYGVAVSSYDQNVYFNLIADSEMLNDVHTMGEILDETFAELKQAAATEAA